MANSPNAQHSQVISRAWQDPAFKQKLLSDPHSALAEEGIQVPAGTNVQVHENTANTTHLVLPQAPAGGVTPAAANSASAVWCVWCAANSSGSSS